MSKAAGKISQISCRDSKVDLSFRFFSFFEMVSFCAGFVFSVSWQCPIGCAAEFGFWRPFWVVEVALKHGCDDFGYKCSLTTAPPCFIIYIYMTEQDKNSIGLSFNQRLIKRKRKKRDRWQKRTSQQLY